MDWGSLALSLCPVLWLLDKGRAGSTLVKGFPLSFSMAALQVSRRAPSKATAMSASLNCNNKQTLPLVQGLCLHTGTAEFSHPWGHLRKSSLCN